MNEVRRASHWIGLPLAVLGGLLWVMTWMDWTFARLLAGDPSSGLATRLLDTQRWLGVCGLAVGLLVLAVGRVILRFLQQRPKSFADSAGRLLALLAVTLAVFVQFVMFDNIPHVTDAISHTFQAKVLALGHLTAPLPPCHESFFQHHIVMTHDGRWFTKYTPGHPLLLALGEVLHLRWLVVPLCHGLAVWALHALIRRFWNKGVAGLASFLFALSPLAVMLGASYMSHTTFLAAVLGGALGVAHLLDDRTTRPWPTACATGFVLGYAILIRPQDAALTLLLMGLAALLAGPATWRRIVPVGLRMAPAFMLALLILLSWNKALYGQPLTIGYGFTTTGFIYPMFQASYGLTEQFTWWQALRQSINSLYRLDQVALGWPTTLPLLALALATRSTRRADWFCVLGFLAVVAMYFPYSYYGLEFEARYYYPALPFIVVLMARASEVVGAWVDRMLRAHRSDMIALPIRTLGGLSLLLLLTAFSLSYYWPHQLWPTYAHDYEQASTRLHELAREAGLRQALVLIDSRGKNDFRYSSGMIYNDPQLRGDVIYARDPGENVDCLKKAFPERTLYRFSPDPGWQSGRFDRIP